MLLRVYKGINIFKRYLGFVIPCIGTWIKVGLIISFVGID